MDCVDCVLKWVEPVSVVIGLVVAYCKYSEYVEQKKTKTLSAFNDRYINDENIQKVVNYLIYVDDNDKNKGLSKDELSPKEPSDNDWEMFFRFFEEMQYSIEQDLITKDMAYDMFAYYALSAFELRENIINAEEEKKYWNKLNQFISSMKGIRDEREKNKSLKLKYNEKD